MLQHYSVSWKKGLAALCLLAVAGLSGCDQKENAAAKVEYDGLSNSQPLRVDANNHTVTMLVQINGRFLTDDTRHGIVFKDGSNGHKSLFMGYATPKAFYEALKEAGGTPGENMTMVKLPPKRMSSFLPLLSTITSSKEYAFAAPCQLTEISSLLPVT